QPPDAEAMGLKGTWTKVQVPCLSLEEHWSRHFGVARCHLLKVDIEGSELNLLDAEAVFLRRVDTLLLEWHKWRVSLDQLKKLLVAHGFSLERILEENENMGTAFFKRVAR